MAVCKLDRQMQSIWQINSVFLMNNLKIMVLIFYHKGDCQLLIQLSRQGKVQGDLSK